MKKIFSTIISAALTLGILSSSVVVGAAQLPQSGDTAQGGSGVSSDIGNISVDPISSFGGLLSNTINNKVDEQQKNNGCNVFSVEMSGKKATVEFETLYDCTLVVAIYDEAGKQMLASGSAKVLKGDKLANVTIETDNMPTYFYIRAYLVDTKTFRPLCTVYKSPNYTKEMQDFLKKTAADFNSNKVLNFDEDNFAVYNDNVKVINKDSNSTKNKVAFTDDKNNKYIIENADDKFKNLKHNDTFAYHYSEDNDKEALIVKVDNVTVDGNTVTIIGQKAEITEIFDYVKIDSKKKSISANYTPPTDDEIKYVGDNTDDESSTYNLKPSQNLVRRSGAFEKDKGIEISEDGVKLHVNIEGEKEFGSVKVSGSVEGSVTAKFGPSMKYYITVSHQYIEIIFDYTLTFEVNIKGELQATKSLGKFQYPVVPGAVNIGIEPSIVFKLGIEIKLDGTLEGKVGIEYSDGDFSKIASAEFNAEISASGSIYLGLSLEPSINIVSDRIAEIKMTAEAGIEVSAEYSKELASASVGVDEEEPDKKHTCDDCVKGEMKFKAELSFEASFLKLEWLTATYKLVDFEHEIGKFYFSITEGKSGWGKCPYISYKTTERIVDSQFNPISGANITIVNSIDGKSYKASTNDKGIAVLYVPNGDYKVKVSKSGGYLDSTYNLEVDGEAQKNTRILLKEGEKPSTGGSNSDGGDDEIMGEPVKSVVTAYEYTMAIAQNGDLYAWGRNNVGQLGDGTTTDRYKPTYIMSNVESVMSTGVSSIAITKNGDLYTWGWNDFGQLGDGTTTARYKPTYIMSNVKSFQYYNRGTSAISAVITKDDKLYTWGQNSVGQLGDGTTTDRYKPTYIMNNVESITIAFYANVVLTKDGKLYTWGRNDYGTLGDGDEDEYHSVLAPKQIMGNTRFKSVSTNGGIVSAITKNGDLYMWGSIKGDYYYDGTYDVNKLWTATPKLILNNVERFDFDTRSAITKDGDLYLWGMINTDLSFDRKYNCTPKKIMSNVALYMGQYSYSWYGVVSKAGDIYVWKQDGRYYPNSFLENELMDRYKYPDKNYVPKKVLSNFASIYRINSNSNIMFALTKNGELYQLLESAFNPIKKMMDNVALFSNNGNTGAILKRNGALYTYGFSKYGEVGNGTTGFVPFSDSFRVTLPTRTDTEQSTASVSQNSMMRTSAMASPMPLSQVSATNAIALANEETEDNTTNTDEDASVIDTTKKEFTSLTPNETYNFYLMKSKTAQNALGSDNLLYITQAKADSEGKLTVKYDTAIEYDSAEYFIVAMTPIDISDAEVSIDSFTANGEKQFVEPTVTLNGETLVEGEDYKVRGDFSFTTAGSYTLKIVGIGLYAGTIEYNYNVNCDYNVTPLVNNSKISAETITKGNTITFTGKASGGTRPYQYKFSAKHSTDSEYTVLKNFSTNKTTFEWKPRKLGTYTVKTEVKDNNGKTAVKIYELTVKPYFGNETTISAKTITKGETITFTGKANGGTAPYQYMFKAKHSTDSSFTILKNFKTEGTTFVWKPTRDGTYTIETEVRDNENMVAVNEFTLVVKAPLANNSTISAKTITKGDTITFTGKASGGTSPYKYQFSAKHSTASEYTVLKEYGTSTSKVWKPTKTGTYTVLTEVKDAKGAVVKKSFTLTVKAPLANDSTISAKTITKGDTITFTGKASGGTSPYKYQFSAKHSTASSYTVLKEYGTSTSKVWRPTKTGTYTVLTEVKDAKGAVVKKSFTLTVKAPLANNSTISAKTITKGNTITFTGKASGGTSPYQYKFSAKHSTASEYTVLKKYSTTATSKVWRPTKTGTYTVLTEVKDAKGTVVKKSFTLTVK